MDRERCSAAGSVEKWVKKSREALDLFYAYAFCDVVVTARQSSRSLKTRHMDRFIHTRMTSVIVLPIYFRNVEKFSYNDIL